MKNQVSDQQDAVIYARYSSHAQRDVSIEQQCRECEIYAKRHGLRILGTYEDHALSGTSDKRPGFQRMIHDAAHAPWSYVIVYSLDRFARDRYDSASKYMPTNNLTTLLIGLVFAIGVVAFMYWFFGTEIGSSIRATGNNAHMVRANGVNTNLMIVLALMLSNGLVALSGALVAQQQGYADVKMGLGAIVMALASIVLGEVLFGRKGGFYRRLSSIVIGSIVYRVIVAVVLQLGLNANNLKLFTAILVGFALSIPMIMEHSAQKKMYNTLTKEMEG